MKGVFNHRPDSPYDDVPGERYHFPEIYLSRVKQTVGDWILFHELKGRGAIPGASACVSFAQVDRIDADPERPGHFYARLSRAGTLPVPVPVNTPGGPLEAAFRKDDGRFTKGAIRNAVRLIAESDFGAIVAFGAGAVEAVTDADADGFAEDATPFRRPLEETLRLGREPWFRRRVLDVYDNRCALTGMRMINGGGAAEVEAAHIVGVGEGGPDLVPNGLALTRTVHWMFDRRLITFDDDMNLIRTPLLPADASRFLGNVTGLTLPPWPVDRPDVRFIRSHRERTYAKVRAGLASG